jgi:urease accessory protein
MGWQGALRLGFRVRNGRTLLADRQRLGPLSVQRPFYPEGGTCHVYLLHPPGGVVGGDSLDLRVVLESGARALITAPGATKFYRSAGERARQTQTLTVANGAGLEWLPHENIYFPGARVRQSTRILLHGDARLCSWEFQCLGRPVIGESFDDGLLDSAVVVERDGRAMVAERLRVTPQTLSRAALLRGLPVSATLIVSPAGAAEVAACRAVLQAADGDHAAVTLLDDVLVVRYLGHSVARARRLFMRAWRTLRPLVFGCEAELPRIWST